MSVENVCCWWVRLLAALAACVFCIACLMLPGRAFAYFEYDPVSISFGAEAVTMKTGETVDIDLTIDPLTEEQLPCCGTSYCPQMCEGMDGMGGCLDDETHMWCTCAGHTWQTVGTKTAVRSSNPYVARASIQDGSLRIVAYGEGMASVTVYATLKGHLDAEKTLSVTVTGQGNVDGPVDDGGSEAGDGSGSAIGRNSHAATEPPALPAEADRFSDVDYASDWVFTEGWLPYVTGQGMMRGYDDGSRAFGKDDPITRGQMATMLYRKASADASDTTDASKYAANSTPFSDNEGGQYYTAAVNWAYGQGVLSGDTDDAGNALGTVRPDDPVTRQELACILNRFALANGASESGSNFAAYAEFADADDVAPWADHAIGWCVTNDVLNGYGATGRLAPAATATRAEAAKMATVVVRDVLGGSCGSDAGADNGSQAAQATGGCCEGDAAASDDCACSPEAKAAGTCCCSSK